MGVAHIHRHVRDEAIEQTPDDLAPGIATLMTDPGLCATCIHSRVIRTRHSAFYLCQRSFTDARFPKYPRLPVVRCIGYAPGTPSVRENPDEPPDSAK